MPFRRLAWALPAAYVVHVAEEASRFTRWAQRNACQRYSQRDFVRNNALGFLTTTGATLAVTRIERRKLDLMYYTLVVARQVFFVGVPDR